MNNPPTAERPLPATERIGWLASAEKSLVGLTLAFGHGFVTRQEAPGAYAYGTVDELRSGAKHGYMLRGSALVMVQGIEQKLFLMMSEGQDGRRWDFPGAYALPSETPAQAALRGLTDNVGLAFRGKRTGWADAAMKIGGDPVLLLSPEEPHKLRGMYAVIDRTYEFFYPLQLSLSTPAKVEPYDLLGRGREVRLFSREQMVHMTATAMTPAARAIWADAEARGALDFIRTVLPAQN